MDKINVRRLEKKDAENIVAIYSAITKKSVSDSFAFVIRDEWSKKDSLSFVAEISERIVGFMICHIISGGFGLEKSAWIATMGVDPQYMGQGIGRKLAEEIFACSVKKGIKEIYSSVKWDSTDLLSFFKTLGFERSNFVNLNKRL